MVSGVNVPDEMAVPATVVEDEATTCVLSVADAKKLGIQPEFVAAWLTLDVHSALDAVGLTALVATALASEAIPCNVLAGYYHDHLLVPTDQVERSIAVLSTLANSYGS